MRTIRRVFVRLPVIAIVALTSVIGTTAASAAPAQTIDDAGLATLAVRQLTRGAGGGPFHFELSDGATPASVHSGVATTTADGDAVDVSGLVGTLAPGTYTLRQDLTQASGRPDRRPLGIHRRRVRRARRSPSTRRTEPRRSRSQRARARRAPSPIRGSRRPKHQRARKLRPQPTRRTHRPPPLPLRRRRPRRSRRLTTAMASPPRSKTRRRTAATATATVSSTRASRTSRRCPRPST